MKSVFSHVGRIVVLFIGIAGVSLPAAAHCDSMNGPVVGAARQALASGDVTPVLKWVRPEREPELRAAFALARKVRAQSAEGRELADRYFFETVVRIHRSGEGEPYTGLTDADPEPGIAAADRALASGNVDALADTVARHVAESVRERFARVQSAEKRANTSVAAGREYVEAYVEFIHYVEKLHGKAADEQHGKAVEK
jgi:hypothetical protein